MGGKLGVAVGAAMLALAVLPAAASAEVFCDYVDGGEPGPAGNILAVTVVGDENFFADFDRRTATALAREAAGRRDHTESLYEGGTRIAARSDGTISVAAPGTGPMTCAGGQPTLTNIDTLRVVTDLGGFAIVDLAAGPLGPGATDEGDGSSEIEIRQAGVYGGLYISGTPGPDNFAATRSRRTAKVSINLNPLEDASSSDVDVRTGAYGFIALLGGRGADRITIGARGRADEETDEFGLALFGGRGDDTIRDASRFTNIYGGSGEDLLRAGGEGGELEGGLGADTLYAGPGGLNLDGGDGADRLIGGAGSDSLDGEGGRDRLVAGAGRDTIRARDGERDVIDCGPGRDRVHGVDDRDRKRNCEPRRRNRNCVRIPPGLPDEVAEEIMFGCLAVAASPASR